MVQELNDYCFSIVSSTTNFGTKPSFVHVSKLPGQGFGSLYLVTRETAKAIVTAGTTARYQGVVWSGRLWLDVDSFEAADKVEDRLKSMGLGYVSYFTGNRGAHFGILRPSPPSHLLPLQDREWVRAHFPEADDSIYTHLHLFRLPGTPHIKTGQPKILMGSCTGKPLIHRAWNPASSNVKLLRPVSQPGTNSVFESLRVMSNTVPTTAGNRHPTLVRLAYALHDRGVDPSVALWWLEEVNKMAEVPKEDWEVEKIVVSIYGVV